MARLSSCDWRRLRKRRPTFTRGCLQWLSATRTASRFKSALRIGRVRSRSGTSGHADCLMQFLMRSAGTKRGRYMLTTDRLREILTAAIDQEAGTYVDALQERWMLPDDGTALTPRSVIVALLALLSGERPVHLPACADRHGSGAVPTAASEPWRRCSGWPWPTASTHGHECLRQAGASCATGIG